MEETSYKCRKCGRTQKTETTTVVDVAVSPEQKAAILSGEFFIRECPDCGERNLVVAPLVYRDPEEKILICLSPEGLGASGEVPGYPTARLVRTAGDLIEKIKIFDAGLDDVAVEMCKFVTSQETGKTVPMKFFRLGGADNTMILTYPENGEMKMLEIGFNVYEDCAAIISRNPAVRDRAKGLVCIDAEWMDSMMK